MKYGIIQDGKLITTTDRRIYGDSLSKELQIEEVETKKVYDEKEKKEINIEETVTKVVEGKPVKFAEIPKNFDQTTQAVYQGDPVDKGDYIECGVIVVDLPEEKGLIFDEPIKEEPVIKK